ncbi:hypothetical protein jhhlp_007616 [Lomentospora prolificans]|uniref:Uncharacterized protein n=1 Tax=Lomentospora prolificans TaxID=41688 RepID=A0A2N3N031_9PEZI|nr:hypothetical protein jhhlp_007616 [Lomentospora prolificans]
MSLTESTSITSTPRLPADQTQASTARLGEPANITPANPTDASKSDDKSSKKRSIFSLGKKKKSDTPEIQPSPKSVAAASPPLSRDTSKLSTTSRSATSPSQNNNEFSFTTYPSSPTRGLSSSPRLSSPAGSQIFERDVQESVVIPTSPAIPSHIQTENHIPPVLNASSEAITDNQLDPDSVEILTHSSHLPAAAAVAGVGPHPTFDQWAEEFVSFADRDPNRDDASNFSPLDSSIDVRRLSFISFADVVQAEHSMHGVSPGKRSSIHLAGLTSIRSPSPMRSPVSSQGPGTSSSPSKSGSVKGLEMSPSRKPLGSPTTTVHGVGAGEINVETMSQALRRTGSGDLGGARSFPTSPIEGPGSR